MFLYSPPSPYVVIDPDKYQICSGETITFLAASYNTNYVYYKWFVNDILISGEEKYNFTYAFQTNDIVYCRITGSTSSSKKSNSISKEITVFPKETPTIIIDYTKYGTDTKILCEGDTALFTSVITFAGYTPTFQWYSNTNGHDWNPISGKIHQNMLYVPVDGEQIACVMESSRSCVFPSGVTSNILTMSVTAKLPVSVSISASPSGSVCPETSVTYTVNGINKGLSPSYQWYVNGTKVGSDSYQYTYSPSDADIISVSMTSSIGCSSNNPATSSTVATVLTNVPVSINLYSIPAYEFEDPGPPALYVAHVPNGHTIFFYTTVVGDCGSPTYQWYMIRGSVITAVGTGPTYGYTPSNGDKIYCVFDSDCQCTTGNPATSITVTISIIPLSEHQITISADKYSICSGDTITFTALQNGYTNPQYQWKANSVNVGTNSSTWITSSLKNGDVISCVCTELGGGTPTSSNNITITVVSKVLPSVTISKLPAGTTCSGTNLNFYISTSQYLGTNPYYAWQVNDGKGYVTVSSGYGNNYTYYQSAILKSGDKIRLTVTGNYSCVTTNTSVSNEITCTITSLVTPSVSISSYPTCIALSDPIVFTVVPTNGGTTPIYNWYYTDLSGNWQLGYTSSVSDTWTSWIFTGYTNLTVSCSMTSNATCAYPLIVTSNFLTLSPCPCGQSSNKILNGGGDNTTDWDSSGGGIGDNWGMDVQAADPAQYSYGATYVTEIGNGTDGFINKFQRVKSHIYRNTLCDIITTGYSFSVTLGNQKYLIDFKYRCGGTDFNYNFNSNQGNGGHMGIWAYYTNGTHECVIDVPPNTGTTILDSKQFTHVNTSINKLWAVSFGHSQPTSDVYFKWEIDEVNLWECPNV